LLGISYGATRHNFLQRKEDKTKDARNKLKAEREAKLLEEKQKSAAGNYCSLIRLICS